MEEILFHPLIFDIINSLAWGSPYWPEVATSLGALLLVLWLAYRIGLRRGAERAALSTGPAAVEEIEHIPTVAEPEPAAEEAPPETPPPGPVAEEAPAVEVAEPEPPSKEEALASAEAPAVEEAVPEPAPPVEEVPAVPEPVEEEPPTEDFFTRLRRGLARTKESFIGRLDQLLKGAKLDEDTYDELEEVLVTADLGVKTAYKLLEKIQTEADRDRLKKPDSVRELLREEIARTLKKVEAPLDVEGHKPFVIMVLGVNGVGKTTTIGKLAWRYSKAGKKVLIAAADTFRAAAIEQVGEWAKRSGSDIVKHEAGSDPGAVAFDSVKAALARNVDVLIIDTAGRLHTRVPLMDELKKVHRVVSRELEGAPHEVLLVLDATTGQNAISQAASFNEAIGVTGIAVTKLDGTAKGGVIVGISDQFEIPIRLIGIGEKMVDLVDFETEPFVEALF